MAKEFFHPSVTADVVVLTEDHKVLLIKRSEEAKAFPGHWAFPGGFMDADDSCIEAAAVRELKEETGLEAKKLELVGVYTKKGRDPRGPVHSTVFVTWLDDGAVSKAKAGDDASEAVLWQWNVQQTDIDTVSVNLTCDSEFSHREIWIRGVVKTDEFGNKRTIVYKQDTYNSKPLAFDHAQILVDAICKKAL